MTDAGAWLDRARALRGEQRMIEADDAIARAADLAPADAAIASFRANLRFELGHRAASLFALARTLAPDRSELLRNHALALAAEGDPAAAEAMLADAVTRAPGWLDGQRVLASLRWTSGNADYAASGYAAGCAAEPASQGLWLGWFSHHAQRRDWGEAAIVLEKARKALGETPALAIAGAFLAEESGDRNAAASCLAALSHVADPFLDLTRLRHALRGGDAARAEAIARTLVASPLAGQAWPYLSAAWRLQRDPRAAWLDGAPPFVATYDVGLSPSELEALAALLRRLHTARQGYGEQSIRGGTQTDRSLLLRHEPELQHLRRRLLACVETFVATLPTPDPAHPLLGRDRAPLRIAGSWSVKLGPGGFNVVHSHPQGWISSAFHLAVPERDPGGAAHEGWLELGAPPPELGLDLQPLARIEPVAGRLVLFASTLWHGTVPIRSGERLAVAFDAIT